MGEARGAVAEAEGPDAAPAALRRVDGHARALRDPVGARVGAEVVVERVALLHEDDEVLDRRAGLRPSRTPARRPRRRRQDGGERERRPHSRAPHGRRT